MSGFVIRYESSSTESDVNGVQRRLGAVYVERAAFGVDVYSYTKRVAEATRWDTLVQADAMAARWDGVAIPVADAVDLE